MYDSDVDAAAPLVDAVIARLQRFYEETPVMMHAIDENGRIELVSNRWLERLGYTRDEVVGRRSVEFLTPECRARATETIDEFYRTGKVENVPYDMVTRSGEIVHVLLSATSEVDDDGNFRRSMAVLQDVSEQRRVEQRAASLNQRLELALSASGIGIWDWDLATGELVWDERMYRIYGVAKEDFGGAFDAWTAGLVPGTREVEEAKVARALAGDEKFDTEFQIVHPARGVRTIRGVGDVYWDEDGTPVRMLGANWDITRERAVSDRMELLIEELHRSNEDLERFAYIASHDLREPLRGMRNFSEFLIEDFGEKLDDTGREYLQTIQTLGARLDAYLEDLLKYARLGQEAMAVQDTPMTELLEEVADTARAGHPDGEVEISVPADLPTIRCDRVKMSMVFGNLIRNALKYNESDVRRVEVTWRRNPADPSMHEFVIRDNGIGIPDHLQERVFTLFKRLHPRDAYGGGTGMGLTLVQRAVERHGGRIWVESGGPGTGSTFRLTLPEQSPVEATSDA